MFSVLKKMRDNRVSCIPIERQLSQNDQHTTRTVGLAFLTDLMFLLRMPDFYKYLDEPVIAFIGDLNGLEEDLTYQELINSVSAPILPEATNQSGKRARSNTIDDSETRKKVTAGAISGLQALVQERDESG